MAHIIVIILIIALIVIIQFRSFWGTTHKIRQFKSIFPKNISDYKLLKDAIIEKIFLDNNKEIAELEKEKERKILAINSEILQLKGANNNFIKAMLEAQEQAVYLNSDGNFKPYQVESARSAVIQRLQAKIIEFESHCSTQVKLKCDENEKLVYTVNADTGISFSHDSSTLRIIIDSINDYLKGNKTVSDFHLLKDIVDRNCDAKEEEISTGIPIPLYMGLVGTMVGILVGILFLWLTGGISDLLSAGVISSDLTESERGIEGLLSGIALAMISSIIGILLTTLGSNYFNIAKSQVESDKHSFLNWIQAKLLPTLSDNVVGAIREMTGNLESFNQKFAQNNENFGKALEKVNESYKLEVQLLETVRKIADKDITHQNLALYNALRLSTTEIKTLAEYLSHCNEYLTNVKVLNENLYLQENRTRVIEDVGVYFKAELDQIDARKGIIAQSVGKIDDYLQHSFEKLNEHTVASLQEFQKTSIKQQEILRDKTGEITKIIGELEKLGEVKRAITGFENAINGQNAKIDRLTDYIEKLAKAKSIDSIVQVDDRTPIWQFALISVIAISCVILTIKSFF